MRKKLLVFGCSYSDKSYVEITTKSEKLKEHMYNNQGNLTEPFDFWPEMMAKKLDMDDRVAWIEEFLIKTSDY